MSLQQLYIVKDESGKLALHFGQNRMMMQTLCLWWGMGFVESFLYET